jgi:hypothetical protein
MAVRVSHEPGRYTLLLRQSAWLDTSFFAAPLARALSLPRADIVRACRLQRGILFEGISEEPALLAAELLEEGGAPAVAVPDEDLAVLPRSVQVSLLRADEDALAAPSLGGTTLPSRWPWGELAFAAAAVLIDADAQTAGLVNKVNGQAFRAAEDRRAFADRALEKARERVFPLAAELARPLPATEDALRAAVGGTGAALQEAVPGFGRVDTVLDLVFSRPFERLRLAGNGRFLGLPRGASRVQLLHGALNEVSRHARDVTLPASALALLHGADSGEYVFDDIRQFDDYCRWSWFWRLQRLKSPPSGTGERMGP